jgi:hypothetical protein
MRKADAQTLTIARPTNPKWRVTKAIWKMQYATNTYENSHLSADKTGYLCLL